MGFRIVAQVGAAAARCGRQATLITRDMNVRGATTETRLAAKLRAVSSESGTVTATKTIYNGNRTSGIRCTVHALRLAILPTITGARRTTSLMMRYLFDRPAHARACSMYMCGQGESVRRSAVADAPAAARPWLAVSPAG